MSSAPSMRSKRPAPGQCAAAFAATRAALLCLLCVFLFGCGAANKPSAAEPLRQSVLISGSASGLQNPYADLSVPTCITKINGLYFIVDCYHDQVLYHDNLTDPVSSFSVLPDFPDEALAATAQNGEAVQGASSAGGMKQPHTIASDGTVYLVDDTENNRVLIYEQGETTGSFLLTQYFDHIGIRPHFTVYDDATQSFLVWSSFSGEMYRFERAEADTRVTLTGIRRIPELAGVYVRSFTIENDDILFVSGLPVPDEVMRSASSGDAQQDDALDLLPVASRAVSQILRCDRKTLAVKERYTVPDALSGMVQILPVRPADAKDEAPGNGYFITVSTDLQGNADAATVLYCDDLSALNAGDFTPLYDRYFEGGGTPYYMGFFDGQYYLTEHRLPGHAVWAFTWNGAGRVTARPVY